MTKNKNKKTTADRIAKHPMHSASDLRYLRNKGYTDDEILAFWDRDHGMGHKPVEHRLTYSGTAAEVVQEVLRDNLSPEAVAATANAVRVQVNRGIEDKSVEQQLKWFADRLVAIVGGEKQYHRLCGELGF